MSQSTISCDTQFSPHASLAALVAHLNARGIFDELRSSVQLAQKTVKDSPSDKLLDILLTLLCGTQSLVQLNTLLRADPALQRAAGRSRCAEQSVAQQTLDAATAENVEQLRHVLTTLLHRHSQVAQHSFRAGWLVLDVDLTGMPAASTPNTASKATSVSHVLAGDANRVACWPVSTPRLFAMPSTRAIPCSCRCCPT